ncbi:MAG TPA: alanine racemase, partial [Candidatus Nanopelagicales bacterium]|nr:alanine racemase [Candidatus Nanopelagicales bacterium]
MSFTLQVDAVRWRENADAVRDKVRAAVRGDGPAELGDLVPVAKGNGYGLGNQRLAREAARLGVDVLAVGTVHEVDQVAAGFGGDILVLTPVEPADTVAAAAWDRVEASGHGARVVRTVASPAGLAVVVGAARDGTARQVVLEGLTSIGRFGLTPQELTAALSEPSTVAALDDGRLVLVGLALHLPLTQPSEEHRAVPGARWHDTV